MQADHCPRKKKRTAVHLFVVSIIPLNASAYYGNNLASIETNAMIMDVAQDAYCCNFSCLTNLTSLSCSVVDVFLVSLTAEVPDTMNYTAATHSRAIKKGSDNALDNNRSVPACFAALRNVVFVSSIKKNIKY